MKLALAAVVALLPALAPAAPVRYEADGIRVGGELVLGAALQLKGVDASTLLVSGAAVETLGAPVDVALDDRHALSLQAGLRLERRADGFLLSTHGAAMVVDVAGRAIQAARSLAFTLTPEGFDFGAHGRVEATSFSARTEAAPATQDGIVSPERRAQQLRGSRAAFRRFVFRGFNPFAPGVAANRETLQTLIPLSNIGD